MHLYAAYVGDWSVYWEDYRWPPLPGARHNAIDDCRAVLELLQHMAADTIDTPAADKEQLTNDTEPA